MKPLAISLLLLLLATVHADPGWQTKIIGNVRIEVPTDCKTNVQNTPGAGGAVQRMKKYSFRDRMLDLELVFLSFPPGTDGNLDGAAANMTAQLKAASGEESLTPWKTTTVSGRPARYIATKPDRRHQARQVTLIDDTKAKNQLVIVDISYDSSSSSGKADSQRIMKSVEIR
ncbi:MAG: hypothetical protein M3N48_07815 [Verrucomicrobiota bacterium]|nr:hypothetical protein [Verrucomicrobiota bacterium]